MSFSENLRMIAAVLLFVLVAALASCGGGASAPSSVSSGQNSIFKTVSTTFSSGTVDTSATVCYHTSIAIDPDDNYPAIAYYDEGSNKNLMYAKWDGSDWDDKVTVDSTGDVGRFASLAFDSAGNPSIGYYDETNMALKWAYDDDDDGNWNEGNWPMTLADNANDDFGKYCSHDISGNSFGFAFYKANTGDLLYYEYDIVTSNTSQIDVDTTDDVGRYCSLKFHSGVPAVSYYNATDGDLWYAIEGSPSWTAQLVEDNYDVGQYSSLDYDGSGNPSIACYVVDGTEGWICWARWNSEEEEWYSVAKVGDEGEKWGQHICHQWYGSAKCGFAFEATDGSDSWLEFILWTPSGEDEYAADTTTDCGDYTSFAWVFGGANRGDAWISHRDFGNYYLRCTFVDD